MSTCNQEIKLRAKTQEEKEKSLPCLWSPLAVIPYGLEERQWDPWSAPSSPSVTSQVTWAINSVLWVSVSLYIGRDHWTRRSFRFLPELRFGAGGSLSDSGNLDSIIQPCTGCGVHWGGRGPGILYLGFILMEMKELDKKNKLSPLLDPMFCHVEFDGAPSANVPDGFLSWKFLEKYLMDGFHLPRICAWSETFPLGWLGHKRRSLASCLLAIGPHHYEWGASVHQKGEELRALRWDH